MTPPFRLTFPRSSASTYSEAVRLAKQSPAYQEIPDGRRLLHVATFGTDAEALQAAAELWSLIRTWKPAILEVDGRRVLPGERWRAGEVLACAARAAWLFATPPRWCTSLPDEEASTWTGRPRFPCRFMLTRERPRLDAIEWDAIDRRADQLRALLGEAGVLACPFLQLGAFEAELAPWRPDAPTSVAHRRRELGVAISVSFEGDAEPPPEEAESLPQIPNTVEELVRQWPPDDRPPAR